MHIFNDSSAISNKDNVFNLSPDNCYKVVINTGKPTCSKFGDDNYMNRDHDNQKITDINAEFSLSEKIKNPCIEKFIPLKIEKSSIIGHPNDPNSYIIHDKSIDDKATFYKASIKLGNKEIGEFHTRYVVHWAAQAGDEHVKHITNFFNPLQSFERNAFAEWENCIQWNKHDKFVKLVKEGRDYAFKWCDINGNGVTANKKFIFPANLVNFNKDYIKDLDDLSEKVNSIYLMARPKLYRHFNDREDELLTHPVEICEFSLLKNGTATPKKLVGVINHEYGIFREYADGNKREFIFSDCTTKGKNIVMTDKDYSYSKDDDTQGFLFLAKYKDNPSCLNRSYNNYSELKAQKYMLGFANEKGCTKMISNVHLYESIDLEKLFTDNQDQAIEVPSRMPNMHDLYDIAQCVSNPTYSDSTFI